MTYTEICSLLESSGIDNADHEAALLLEKFCGVSPAALPFSKSENFSSDELEAAVKRRQSREPLQYILGEWYFCTEKYKVNENCLIPRPDTELLVEIAAKLLPPNACFADLCTGSGCVAISLLCMRDDCRAVAAELYPKTLSIATENAKINGVSERFVPLLTDVLAPPALGDKELSFDAIISNPPYIPTNDIDKLAPEIFSEPRVAFDGGEDGMLFYRTIVKNYRPFLKSNGFFAFEIGYDQGEKINELAVSNSLSCKIFRDLGNNPRVAILK